MTTASDLIGKVFPVLDDGHVVLVDVMGDDQSVVDAARVSFGKGTTRLREDRDLIRYLMRHHHGTPLEMAEIKLRVRCPMDAWRQWIRHRTANVNEYSTRYSEAIDSRQRTGPDAWRLQSGTNKQGSTGFVTEWGGDPALPDAVAEAFGPDVTPGQYLSHREHLAHAMADEVYKERLAFGVAREQARKDLPLSTYTEAYWKCDLRNVLHFLGLRMDAHAQAEIRAYADVIGREIVAKLFPLAWEAFEDYALNAVTLSAKDLELARHYLAPFTTRNPDDIIPNARELAEAHAKLKRLGVLPRPD